LEIGVRVEVFGAHILNLYGNLQDGVVGKIDLFLAKGEVRIYLKNRNGTVNSRYTSSLEIGLLIHTTEVWIHYDFEVSFDGQFKDDKKLLTI
jgi:hypothetical protein